MTVMDQRKRMMRQLWPKKTLEMCMMIFTTPLWSNMIKRDKTVIKLIWASYFVFISLLIGSHGSHQITRQRPDHTAETRSHGINQVTRDKLGTKRDLQAPHGGPGYGVMVHIFMGLLQCLPIHTTAAHISPPTFRKLEFAISDICPCNICPYLKYLICYWPNFDQFCPGDIWTVTP